MVFAIGVFGNLFTGMLNTCLYSIYKNANDSDVFVFWQNINSKAFLAIKQAYPRVKFIETQFNLVEKYQRRGSKMLFWEAAANELKKHGFREACFMDVDTLVLKDIKHFYRDEFDIAFSVKNEKWPLNTGVMLVKLSDKVLNFITKWKEHSMNNVRDPLNYEKAKSHEYPYGGPDQMAFHQMLSFNKDQMSYDLNGLLFNAYDSKHFNETRSKEITEDTHIIHFKGGWQKVIIEGGTFSKKRTLADSREMYISYIKMAEDGLAHINNNLYTELTLSEIGIAKPHYLKNSYKINYLDYSLIQFISNVKTLFWSYRKAAFTKFKKS